MDPKDALLYMLSYIFIDKNRLGGVGKGRVVSWLVVSMLYEREEIRVGFWAGGLDLRTALSCWLCRSK